MTKILAALFITGLLSLAPGAGVARAVQITFEAIDLSDVAPGEDLWSYSYRVTDFTPTPNVAFETLFDPTLYRGLQDPPPGVAGWDIFSIQPDLNLPDVGRYSSLALDAAAILTEPFVLTFVWLGGPGTAPGIQPFEINAFDVQGGFLATLDTGFTTPAGAQPVAGPATLALTVAGIVGLGLLRPRSKS
jgi:hypothetical protein